jgi:hypothetical protein
MTAPHDHAGVRQLAGFLQVDYAADNRSCSRNSGNHVSNSLARIETSGRKSSQSRIAANAM